MRAVPCEYDRRDLREGPHRDVTVVKDATASYSDTEMRAALEVNIPNYAGAILTADEVVDARGCVVLPGFVDAHSHSIDGGISLISADATDKVRKLDELAPFAAEDFNGAVCDDLVRVHVCRGARTGLENIDNELVVPFALDDFLRGLLDGGGGFGRDKPESGV